MQFVLNAGARSGFGRLTAETLSQTGLTVFGGVRDRAGRPGDPEVDRALGLAAEARGWKVDFLDVTSTPAAVIWYRRAFGAKLRQMREADPFGFAWSLGRHARDLSREGMAEAVANALGTRS